MLLLECYINSRLHSPDLLGFVTVPFLDFGFFDMARMELRALGLFHFMVEKGWGGEWVINCTNSLSYLGVLFSI